MIFYQHQTFHFSKNTAFYLKRHKGRTSLHWHGAIEFLFFLKGGLEVNLNGKTYTAKDGDLIVVNSSVVHSSKIVGAPDYYFLIASADFFKNNNLYSDKTFFTPQINTEKAKEIFNKIIFEYENEGEHSNVLITAYLMELFVYLNRKHLDSENSEISTDNKKLLMVRNAMRYLDDHFTEKLSADKIAEDLHYSKSYLSHSFKEITRHSLIGYVNLLRCQHARTMLLNNYSIKQASKACGFTEVSYFTRVFKKTMGVLPSAVNKEIFNVYN